MSSLSLLLLPVIILVASSTNAAPSARTLFTETQEIIGEAENTRGSQTLGELQKVFGGPHNSYRFGPGRPSSSFTTFRERARSFAGAPAVRQSQGEGRSRRIAREAPFSAGVADHGHTLPDDVNLVCFNNPLVGSNCEVVYKPLVPTAPRALRLRSDYVLPKEADYFLLDAQSCETYEVPKPTNHQIVVPNGEGNGGIWFLGVIDHNGPPCDSVFPNRK